MIGIRVAPYQIIVGCQTGTVCPAVRPQLDTTTTAGTRLRSAGLRPGVSLWRSINGAGPEVGPSSAVALLSILRSSTATEDGRRMDAPVVVSRCAGATRAHLG